MAKEQGPDIEYIRELKTYLEGRFSSQKAQILKARQLRTMRHPITIPAQYAKTTQEVRTPLLADMNQRTVGALSVNYATWQRSPLGMGDTAQENSSLVEKWLGAAHRRMEKESGRRVFRNSISSAVGDGMGVLGYSYKPYNYPLMRRRKGEEPEDYVDRVNGKYKAAPFPFGFRDIDPLSYFYHDTGDGTQEVLLIEKVPLKPLLDSLGVYEADGVFLDKEPGMAVSPDAQVGGGEEAQLLTHWTKDWVTYVVKDKVAKRYNHKFGRVPFFHFAGLSSHEPELEQQYKPVFHAFFDLIPLLDRLLTMKSNVMYLMSFPQLILKLVQSRGGAVPGITPSAPNVQLGPILNLYEGESLEALQLPPVGPDLNQMIQMVMQLIETTGLGQAMRGNIGSDASGYLANQMITASQLNFDPLVDNATMAWEQGGEWLLEMVDKHMSRPVYVWGEKPGGKGENWLALSSKEINGYYAVSCKIEPLMPSNAIMEGRFGLEQYSGGAISMKTQREKFLHLEAPEDEEKERLKEEFKATPYVHDLLMRKIAQKAGMLPPEPPVPPPPSGLVGPDGMPLGGLGMPQAPGQGMPLQPSPNAGAMSPGQTQMGPGPIQQPGGNMPRPMQTNAGGV